MSFNQGKLREPVEAAKKKYAKVPIGGRHPDPKQYDLVRREPTERDKADCGEDVVCWKQDPEMSPVKIYSDHAVSEPKPIFSVYSQRVGVYRQPCSIHLA